MEVDSRLAEAERVSSPARRAIAERLQSRVSEIEALSRRYCASVDERLKRASDELPGHALFEKIDALDEAAERLGGPEGLPRRF